jgi:hypothetical protein
MKGPKSILYKLKSIETINDIKRWFFEKINKINKPLVNLTKMRRKTT